MGFNSPEAKEWKEIPANHVFVMLKLPHLS